jgi:hypothetical protein
MKRFLFNFRFSSTVCALLCSCSAARSIVISEELRLIPFPKEITLERGTFSLEHPLVLEVPNGSSNVIAQLLIDELNQVSLKLSEVRGLTSSVPAFRISGQPGTLKTPPLPTNDVPEKYALDVWTNEIVGAAQDATGLIYAAQTLCQLIRANREGNSLPSLTIRDWPKLRWRGFQDDMTRGPSSTLANLKIEAGLGSYFKFNLMTYYMEYQYAFKKHPQIGPTNGSLTAEDLQALVRHCQSLHLDVLGNQQSFGHFGRILEHPEFANLRETADVLTPVREETYQLLDDLYSEVCPLVPFYWFNVCCDETAGLGTGPARELAASIGVGGVYARHLVRLHDMLRDKYHKRMMMWGDIILQHPDHLKEIPKDTIMLSWGYDSRPSYDSQIVPFAKSGYDFFVCPGVSDWSRILPDFGVAVTNIYNFVRDGLKQGALGVINTDWEDDGEALKAVKWHADAWAAECAWNGCFTEPDVFNRRVGAVLFGEKGSNFGQAVELLARAHRLPGMNGMLNSRFWDMRFVPAAAPAVIQAQATDLLAVVEPALVLLQDCRHEARRNRQVVNTFIFGARRMELLAQRMLDGLEAGRLYAQAYEAAAGHDSKSTEHAADAKSALQLVEQLIRKERDAHYALSRQFTALWLLESKPYALDWTLRRYTNAVSSFDSLLQKIATAQKAAAAGQPLPSPVEVGLAATNAPAR